MLQDPVVQGRQEGTSQLHHHHSDPHLRAARKNRYALH